MESEKVNAKNLKIVSERSKKIEKVSNVLKVASEIGSILMGLKVKPNVFDIVGFAFRAAKTSLDAYKTIRDNRSEDPFCYFFTYDSNGNEKFIRGWKKLSVFPEFVKKHIDNLKIVDEYWNGSEDDYAPVIGEINNEKIGFVSRLKTQEVYRNHYYYLEDREKETFEAISKIVNKDLNSKHIKFILGRFFSDEINLENFIPTKQYNLILQRLEKFIKAGLHRNVLFEGVPGTGKSFGLQYIVQNLGLTSLRIDLSNLSESGNSQQPLMEFLFNAVKPDVVIIDDIDRASDNSRMLHFVENISKSCKLLLATANQQNWMTSALLRPGRFDEIITIGNLDFDTIVKLVGDEKLADKMRDLPVAYISEFVKVKNVMGVEQALEELPVLFKRANSIAQRNEEDED